MRHIVGGRGSEGGMMGTEEDSDGVRVGRGGGRDERSEGKKEYECMRNREEIT